MSEPVLERLFSSLVGELRSIVREEIAKAPTGKATVRPGWMTPPRAAVALEVPRKRVYEVVKAGRVKTRSCRPYDKNCKRVEVHMESLEAALNGDAPAPAIDLAKVREARGGK